LHAQVLLWYTTVMADEPLPLAMDDDMREAVGSAYETGNVFTVAYNGADGWPHVSRRGTVQVLGPDQLALWVRKRDDGLAAALATAPELTLFFIDLMGRGVVYTFYGRGHLSEDADVRERVWGGSPAREQGQDPERNGVAVIVDLVRIVSQGRRPEQNFVMQSAEPSR
jgi:hypothetical protein